MATETTPRGYRYPDGNEPPALDILLGHLADDVDTDVQDIDDRLDDAEAAVSALQSATADTGSLPDGGAPDPIASWGAGWSPYASGVWASGIRVRRWGPIVQITGAVQKGSAWAAGETVLTLAVGFRPDSHLDNRTFTAETSGAVKVDLAAGAGAVPINLVFLRA